MSHAGHPTPDRRRALLGAGIAAVALAGLAATMLFDDEPVLTTAPAPTLSASPVPAPSDSLTASPSVPASSPASATAPASARASALPSAAPSASPSASGRTAGTIPERKYFALDAPSAKLFPQPLTMHERGSVAQSFAFDVVNRRMYIAQIRDGSSGDDLCISELDMDGNVTGYMHIDSAGHGVSIGAEPVGSSTYLWTEANAHRSDRSGRGTQLQRFKFVDGQKPAPRTFFRGSNNITAATDPVNRRLLVRRFVSGGPEFTVYDLADAARGDFSRPVFPPRVIPARGSGTGQGYTFLGEYLYEWEGTANRMNSRLSSVNLRTGEVRQDRVLTRAGESLPLREPEGVAIQISPEGKARLAFGFAHPGAGGRMQQSIFYKDALKG